MVLKSWLFWAGQLSLVLAALTLSQGKASAQLIWGRGGWPGYRMRHDLLGQSYSDVGPRGRGYYTPTFLPGIDDFNGPSRAYTPIFNAPQAAPEGAGWLANDRDVPSVLNAPRRKAGGGIRRLFSKR